MMTKYPESNSKVNPNYVPESSVKKEYIEREAVLKEICFDCCECDTENPFACEGCSEYTSILLIPAADVEPVRHARWVKITKPQKSNEGFFYWNAIPKTIYFCSYCGRKENKKEPYCNCGAKMDKE